MSKTIMNFLLTILLALVLGLFLPWWSIMLSGFLTAIVVPLKKLKVFFVPFLAIALYWMTYSLMLTQSNDFILSKKIGLLFTLGSNWILVLFITGLVGGLATGVAAVFGKQILLFIKGNKKIGQ